MAQSPIEVLSALESVVSEYPYSRWATEAARRMAEYAMMIGDYERAREALQTAMARRPNSPDMPAMKMQSGDCLRELGRHGEAIEVYREALNGETDPRRAFQAEQSIALCHVALKQYYLATEQMDGILQRYANRPELPPIYLTQGLCFEELNDFAKAEARYGELLARFPQSLEAELARARKADLASPLLKSAPPALPPPGAPAFPAPWAPSGAAAP
ncbi:MAG: Tetratricopeptide repeat protein [candidate division BRC1 bacterium ADurb.BinA364]|nr:MAG: Tetratricopeptide repeat protein [candidate division BRC1 bacterium ADurb.BinA364]